MTARDSRGDAIREIGDLGHGPVTTQPMVDETRPANYFRENILPLNLDGPNDLAGISLNFLGETDI